MKHEGSRRLGIKNKQDFVLLNLHYLCSLIGIIMGLCIYDSGRIKDADSLPHLIDEVKDIANIHGWELDINECSFPNNTFDNQENLGSIYGISFTPPECEIISLTFLSNGVMVCPTRVLFFGNSKNETERNYIYQLFAKTQYAGMAIHAVIINLFRYLCNKYLVDFIYFRDYSSLFFPIYQLPSSSCFILNSILSKSSFSLS